MNGIVQPRHTGFDGVEVDEAACFTVQAPACLYIHDLLQLFIEALVLEDVHAHLCCVVDHEGQLLPLVGDDPQLTSQSATRHDIDFTVDVADGSELVVRLAAKAPVDRQRRARLHLLATLYALHVLPLLEAAEDDLRASGALTKLEHDCLSLAVSGTSGVDIGERVELSAPAVGILLRRAADRLGAGSFTEAATMAMAGNLISR